MNLEILLAEREIYRQLVRLARAMDDRQWTRVADLVTRDVSDLHTSMDARSDQSFRTLGDYHDEWLMVEGNWLISRRVKYNRATLGSFAVLGRAPD